MKRNNKHYMIRKQCGKDVIHLYDPIFGRNFYAVVGKPQKVYCAALKRLFNYESAVEHDHSGYFQVLETEDKEVGTLWSCDSSSTLMHECLHATFWTMREVGVPLTEASEEAYTYYQEFLYDALTRKGMR